MSTRVDIELSNDKEINDLLEKLSGLCEKKNEKIKIKDERGNAKHFFGLGGSCCN